MEENLQSLIQLFKSDSKIKEILLKIAPPNFYSNDDVIEYSDKLSAAMDDISFEMEQIYSQQVFPISDNIKEIIIHNLNYIKDKVRTTFNPTELKKIYTELFADMSPLFVKDVGNVCIGYIKNKQHYYQNGRYVVLSEVASEAKSVNEILHFLHSYICNNDAILRKMPIIERKRIGIYGNCTLFGTSNHIAKDIFDSMPTNEEDREIGETYIIGLEDRVLMMVRDMGHALTIDIEEDKSKKTAFVKYFIPKICNPEKVNKLRGIHKVPVSQEWGDIFANGMYETSIEGFGRDMVKFIEQVPTDEDIAPVPPPTPEEESKCLAHMDINANITESEEQTVQTFISWIKEQDNKFIDR